MDIVAETRDYILVVMKEEDRNKYNSSYCILNKEFGTPEAICGVLSAGYTHLSQMQQDLDASRSKFNSSKFSIVK